MSRRKLPPLPVDVDPTSAEAIPALLTLFVERLPDSYQVHDESTTFRHLVEAEHPAAWKAYVDAHWARHFYELLSAEANRQRHQAKRSRRTATNRDRVSKRPVTDISHSVDNHGWRKKLMAMTKLEVATTRQRYESSAKSNIIQASFYRRIERRMKHDTETVAERWSEAELENLNDQVFGPDAGPVVP